MTVLTQIAKGMCHTDSESGDELLKLLNSAKWYLWHGNAEQALEQLGECYELNDNPELHYDKRGKLAQRLDDMITYIDNALTTAATGAPR